MSRFSKKSARNRQAFADINVTPMIDLMSLLLICVMATAPMMTTGVALDLPKGDGKALEDVDKSVDITVDAAGKIYIADTEMTPKMLVSKLQAMLKANPALKVVVGGDKAASYGQVMELMSYLHLAGIAKVGLKTGELLDINAVDRKGK